MLGLPASRRVTVAKGPVSQDQVRAAIRREVQKEIAEILGSCVGPEEQRFAIDRLKVGLSPKLIGDKLRERRASASNALKRHQADWDRAFSAASGGPKKSGPEKSSR